LPTKSDHYRISLRRQREPWLCGGTAAAGFPYDRTSVAACTAAASSPASTVTTNTTASNNQMLNKSASGYIERAV
jgi:hypothetical protein